MPSVYGLNAKGRGQKKNGIMWEKFPNWGGVSDPNPLLDVYLPSYFWHAKMILRCYKNIFKNNSERPVDALAENGKLLTY